MRHPTRANNADIDTTFGKRLTSARESLGLSQRALSSRLAESGLSLDASALSRIENGTRPVKLTEAATIADVLNMNLESIVRGFSGPDRAVERAISEVSSTFVDAQEAAIRYLTAQKELANELVLSRASGHRGLGHLRLGLAQIAELAESKVRSEVLEEIREIADFANESDPRSDSCSEYLGELKAEPAWSAWIASWTTDFFEPKDLARGEHQEES